MNHYMPEIYWHDRTAILNVDCHPLTNGEYRIVTCSVQKEIRIWKYCFDESADTPTSSLSVTFLANLVGHQVTVNQVKFSPNASINYGMLASGDCHGRVYVWQLSDQPPPPPSDDMLPNKENWVRLKTVSHNSDITAIAWSPDGKLFVSTSNDDFLCVTEALTGKRIFSIPNFRHFPNGVSWDPLGKYIVTMSTDRKMDIIDAAKGTKLRSFGSADIEAKVVVDTTLEAKNYKLFHDDQLMSFQRGVTFSPCGQLIIAPCATLESGECEMYGTYIFKRSELDREKPFAFLPYPKATFLARCCPVLMELEPTGINFTGLPYRVLWFVLTRDAVIFYDSQHDTPIAFVDNIHYNGLTDARWNADGQNVVVSSLEGYCSFIKMKFEKWGTPMNMEKMPERPSSPQLIQVPKKRKQKEKKEKESVIEETEACKSPQPQAQAKLTPLRNQSSTPKTGGLLKFLKKADGDKTPNSSKIAIEENTQKEGPSSAESAVGTVASDAPNSITNKGTAIPPKPKKRIDFITIQE